MLSTVPTTFHPGHPGMSTQGDIPMAKTEAKLSRLHLDTTAGVLPVEGRE